MYRKCGKSLNEYILGGIANDFYADYVRNKLNAAISSMSSQIEDYVKNPGHDFTRNRKMNLPRQ